jgi:hypothetical protein
VQISEILLCIINEICCAKIRFHYSSFIIQKRNWEFEQREGWREREKGRVGEWVSGRRGDE